VQKVPALIVQSEIPNELDSGTELQLLGSAIWRLGAGSFEEAVAILQERGFDVSDTAEPIESTVGSKIDGVATEFRVLSRPGAWLAFYPRRDVFISVIGYEFDLSEVELVTITDAAPYLESSQMPYLRGRRR
jgi:hypothetical protein